MEKRLILMVILLLVATIAFGQVQSERSIKRKDLPWKRVEYTSNKICFRAYGIGESNDMAVSKKRATVDAQVNVIPVIEKYLKDKLDIDIKLTILNDISYNKQVVKQNKEGMFITYIILEMPKESLKKNPELKDYWGLL